MKIGSIFSPYFLMVLSVPAFLGAKEIDPSLARDGMLIRRAEFKENFKWVTQADVLGIPVFRSGEKVLFYDVADKPSFLDINNFKYMVMVSASKHTVFGRQIREHPGVIGIFSKPDSFYDHVLIELSSLRERDELASVAHAETGACGALIPVSLTSPLVALPTALPAVWSTGVAFSSVKTLLEQVSATAITATIKTLENLGTRFHAGANATVTVSTIKSLWQGVLPSGATLTETSNGTASAQNNLIVTIPGTDDSGTALIIGAHMDSINRSNQSVAPGADDDASGIAILTEVLRVLKASNARFSRTIEVHGYGAEEVGLVGSNAIAVSYGASARKVAGMLQLDMTGFSTAVNKGKIFLATNDTSPVLRRQIKDLSAAYSIALIEEAQLDAGTSDHRSWTDAGFHAVFPFEHPTQYNKAIHTANDTSDLLDPTHSALFGKLTLAWLAHAAGLTGLTAAHTAAKATITSAGVDIKLGVVASTTAGERMVVSGLSSVDSVTACTLGKVTDATCTDTPRDMVLAFNRNGRNFFYEPTDQSFSSGQWHRLVAYDANGIVLAERTIQLQKK